MDLTRITPPCMNWTDSNRPEQWNKFKRHVDIMFFGPLKAKREERKCPTNYFGQAKEEGIITQRGVTYLKKIQRNWTRIIPDFKLRYSQS
ncbi:hypothetical protein DPMN_148428 [Dreissena polymorpha]|uniref:Uncharacterized protein n=1 Tax=Dreissena polymorpha TaxID=45954 RepID=A0A9D4F9U1_DREPO|nr:hypothetical protein DPMN_148428 [Dreissena polymorpha]